jgi:hypothetical protein
MPQPAMPPKDHQADPLLFRQPDPA